ncbi:hypothetical protein FRC09_017845 [Ceratobasidium sp. 395]|nr:hypothetical protein FRC09_017845 [Ceratobasidium sp. 395]
MLPIVWQDVDMKYLFRLISGTNITETSTNYLKGYAIHFPATPDPTRFAIHAPFVKTLRVSDLYVVNFPSEWPSSGPDATLNPLLPNLQRLAITFFHVVKSTLRINWISRLLYPGLLGLETFFSYELPSDQIEYQPWLNHDFCLELVDQISRVCPRIETLRLFPKDLAQLDEDHGIRIYNQIASLQHLRSLTFSGTMVHEELLKVLGGLAHLETLSLCTDPTEEWDYDESPLAVSNDSFASLRHLCLYGLHESTMSRVCKVPPLFRHLVKTTIIFEDQCFDENLGDDERSDVAVTCLGQNSPHLEELTILPRGNNGWFVISRPTLDMFKHMPLRYLRLGHFTFDGVHIDEYNESEDEGVNDRGNRFESIWQDFLASVPQLEELRLERQSFDPQLLQLIALRLPNLRLLVFGNLDLGKFKSSGKTKAVAVQPVTLRGHSYFRTRKSFWRDEHHDPPDEQTIYNAAKFVAYRIVRLQG